MNEAEMRHIIESAIKPGYSLESHKRFPFSKENLILKKNSVPFLRFEPYDDHWAIKFTDISSKQHCYKIPDGQNQDFIREFILATERYMEATHSAMRALSDLKQLSTSPKEYIRETRLKKIGI